jgi:hypothetical protein
MIGDDPYVAAAPPAGRRTAVVALIQGPSSAWNAARPYRHRCAGVSTRVRYAGCTVGLVRVVVVGDWEFHITEQSDGLYVSVPDCGGMADSVPRVPEQLVWAESAFATLPGLRRVWPTTWAVPPDALADLGALFERSGGHW